LSYEKVTCTTFVLAATHAGVQTKFSKDSTKISVPPGDWRKPTFSGSVDCDRLEDIIIVDDREFPCDSLAHLRTESILEIKILSADESLLLYGASAFGKKALVITTNRDLSKWNRADEKPPEIKKP
jgi:hypothetical protein